MAAQIRTTDRQRKLIRHPHLCKRIVDIRQVIEPDLRALCDRLNATPRKCPGWRTPAEIFKQKMLESRR